MEGACYGPCNVFCSTYLITPLSDGLRDTYEVDLLEGIGAEEACSYLSGNDNDGSAVEHGICHTRYGVSRTRATSDDTYTHLARRAGIALGCMSGTLLVAYEYLLEVILMVKHGVKHGHDATARVAEHCVDSLVDKCSHESF
jgi:hypothetical protein